MKSLPFMPEIWQAKLKVLQGPGEAQTRRLLPLQPPVDVDRWAMRDGIFQFYHGDSHYVEFDQKPRYHEGEVAYVPEAWGETSGELLPKTVLYKAEFGGSVIEWRSPRFMPAWAARWFVQIVGPPVPQRVMEITEAEAMAEGAESISLGGYGFNLVSSYRQGFERMWDSVYPRHPFSSNPFVWVYTFQLVDKPVGTEGRRPCRGWRIGVEYDQRIL